MDEHHIKEKLEASGRYVRERGIGDWAIKAAGTIFATLLAMHLYIKNQDISLIMLKNSDNLIEQKLDAEIMARKEAIRDMNAVLATLAQATKTLAENQIGIKKDSERNREAIDRHQGPGGGHYK